jgi:hypothetical protein
MWPFTSKKVFASNTGKVLSAPAVRDLLGGFAVLGDTAYAEVNSAWLAGYGDTFNSEIFRLNVTKWDARFDCNHFATFYVALAQLKFYVEQFNTFIKADSLAVGELWYRPASGGAHAIVFALTERGLVLIEPQTRKEVVLTPDEWASRFFVRL